MLACASDVVLAMTAVVVVAIIAAVGATVPLVIFAAAHGLVADAGWSWR